MRRYLPNSDIWWDDEEDNSFSLKPEAKIHYDYLHYIGGTNNHGIRYRRHHLNEYLKSVGTVATNKIPIHPTKAVIISAAVGSDPYVDWAIQNNIPIYYDRTDYWNECIYDEKYHHCEDKLLQHAKVITCSSKYLSEITPNGIRIDNGAEIADCQPAEKEAQREDIVAYVGKELGKIDIDFCQDLMKRYPHYRFVSIGPEIPNWEHMDYLPHSEMMKFLMKCKVGVIPLKVCEYTLAQFNLKYWDYKQAGLEVVTTIDYNYHDAVMKPWDLVCNEICIAFGLESQKLVPFIERFVDDRQYRIWWSLSHKCNFNCPYCCQRTAQNKYEVTTEEIFQVAKKLNELMTDSDYRDFRISLLGGEPAIFDLPKLLSVISNGLHKKLTVLLLTNFSLHDAEWWNSLADYCKIELLASCHLSQINDIDAWIDKALKLKNISFKAKLVVDDSNFEEVKKWHHYMTEKGLKVTLEGCRDEKHQPLFSEEVYKFIQEHDIPAYSMDGRDITQTEAIIQFHEKAADSVKCWRRLSIKGATVYSGCKLTMPEFPIYELETLEPQISYCDKAKLCNLCKVNKVYNYER